MKKFALAIALLFSVVASQAQTKSAQSTSDDNKDDQESLGKAYFSQIMGVALSATSNMKLFHFVYDWIGTPYHFGGSSRRGIDCSAFTKELYSEVFNLDIKRNSRDIFSMVNPVGKDELKEGDLVFFKIHSRSISHVGIYLGNNKFAHASSRGVAISSLDDAYYSRFFYKGGRLLASFKDEFKGSASTGSNDMGDDVDESKN
ncbi:NlpC/P60 family protein [Mucilaginibacter sp. cycad4]|uniref:C40 family peptidase n=1 Tax=Mucilaginibacter rubeus TaxID=2027860 RepID=A0AAE6JLD3_9SPHI|nr:MULTISPECIES: NlpC/P60 family protein [Mucilaginibacter]QEM07453.1 glycoside hydrolase [Mucilaginibacter rubeus]QEM19906.1 glycoside hydrolase [Mucilaginibacter gossypii]QTE35079.1 NlpC/P60 family protein [Mucilaginibacter gossypii]QTE43387.1 C40 family peptidase [Mucilaginibacter rubeus]QTE49987.1 C40 family peptidase [Mucilaginibacter rubeus]